MMRISLFALPLALLATALPVAGQTPISGPERGAPLTPIKARATSGAQRGTEFDAAQALGKSPGALLFVDQITRATAPVIRSFDNFLQEYAPLGFKGFCVSSHPEKDAEERMSSVSRALRLANAISISAINPGSLDAYSLNPDCPLTLVLVKDAVVHRSIAISDPGRPTVESLRGWVEEVTGKMPEDERGLRELIADRLPDDPKELKKQIVRLMLEVQQLQQQLDPNTQGSRSSRGTGRGPRGFRTEERSGRRGIGAVPEDADLRLLMLGVARNNTTETELDAFFTKVALRLKGKPELKPATVEMFRLMLSLDLGGEGAAARIRLWLDQNHPDAPPRDK